MDWICEPNDFQDIDSNSVPICIIRVCPNNDNTCVGGFVCFVKFCNTFDN